MPDFLTPRIKFKKRIRGPIGPWDLLAYGPNPYIAEITGFDKEYTYSRRFLGSRVSSLGLVWHVVEQWDRPVLLDIRAEMRGWYILHGTGFDNLQLSEVSEGVIAQLLSEPLFSTGYMRILDDSLNTPLPKQKKRGSRLLPMFVIQSLVDTSEVPEPQLIAKPKPAPTLSEDWVGRMAERYKQQMEAEKKKPAIFTGAVGVYNGVVIRENRVGAWERIDAALGSLDSDTQIMFEIPPPEKKKKKRPEPKRKNLPAILPHDNGRKFNFED